MSEEVTWSNLSGFQRDMTLVLCDVDRAYGLEIKRELEEMRDEDVNNGRLYPNLDTLVEYGFVD